MRIGDRLRRFFEPDDKAASDPNKNGGGGGDLSALRKAPEIDPLLGSIAYQLSPYLQSMQLGSGGRYNPDDLLNRKGFDIYQRMMLDEQVKAVVRFKLSAVLSRGWQLEFPEDSELAETERLERIKITEHGIRQMGGAFKTGMHTVLRAVWQGFSITEKEHARYDYKGKTWIGLKALMARPFDTIYFKSDPHGHIEKCVQRMPGQPETEIPLNRVVYMVHNPDMDPHYGQSDLREAYRAYFSKDMAYRFRNIYLERMAGGMVVLQPDVGVTIPRGSPDWIALENLLKNIGAATGMLLPPGVKANVIHPATTDAFKLAIEADNLAIAKALLVPNLLGITETGQTGAYSQSQTQFEAFLWTLDEIASSLEETLTEQIFAELARANWQDGLGPNFRMKPMSDAQRDALLKQWAEMVAKGAVEATDTDEKHVRKLMDFPEKGAPIAKAPAIDPATGLPIPGAQPGGEPPKLGPDGKPIEPPPQPGEKPKPGAAPAAGPAGGGAPARPPLEETLRGRRVHRHSHDHVHNRRRYSAGEERFQFALAKQRTESIEANARASLKAGIKTGVSEMVNALLKLGSEALVLEALEFSGGAKAAVKRAIRDGMVDAATLGLKLAAGEVSTARGGARVRATAAPVVVQTGPVTPAQPRVLRVIKVVKERDADGYASRVEETPVYEDPK